MNVRQLHCPNCGSQLHIADDVEVVTCAYCSTQLVVTRSENSVMLRMGETLRDAIADSSSRTQEAIEQSSYVTRDELRRVQQMQQYSNLRLMLANLQAEIREFERENPKYRRNKQYRQLQAQEASLQSEFVQLQRTLYPERFQTVQNRQAPPKQQKSTSTYQFERALQAIKHVFRWVLLWPFLIAGILWRLGPVGKIGAVVWAFMVWPIYLYVPLAICGLVTGGVPQ